MKKTRALALSAAVAATGLALVAMAVLVGGLSPASRQPVTQYILAGCFLFLLVLVLAYPLLADAAYRKMLRSALFAAATGLLMILIFLGFMWMLLSPGAVTVMARVFLVLYGLALCMGAFANYLLSDGRNRVYALSIAREVPFVYYRYRT
jgi:hypothetical protein